MTADMSLIVVAMVQPLLWKGLEIGEAKLDRVRERNNTDKWRKGQGKEWWQKASYKRLTNDGCSSWDCVLNR
jgi:hypothetical protein